MKEKEEVCKSQVNSSNESQKYIEIDMLRDIASVCLMQDKFDYFKYSKEERIKIKIRKNINFGNKFYLSDYFDFLPNGIIDKKATGIGATYLEMNSKRDSIIVTPTKILAYLKKSKDKDNFFYIGSKIGDDAKAITNNDIKEYIKRDIEFKKIFVVADSLERLIEVFKELGIDYGKKYFIMYDEINKFIEDSNFRDKLMIAFDYYKDFDINNRAMVTATLNDYSHPIIKNEGKTYLKIPQRKRDITVINTKKSKFVVFEEIKRLVENNPDEKIVIAINSTSIPLAIINLLLEHGVAKEEEVFIACSSTKSGEMAFKDYYIELNNKHENLPRKIGFITSTYFFGIDIKDSYHLITVSCMDKPHHKLSSNDMIQIYGRNRNTGGILSDTIVVETLGVKDKGRSVGEGYYNEKTKKYISCCQEAIKLLNKTNEIYLNLQNIDKEFTKKDGVENMTSELEKAFFNSLYIRKDIEKEYQPAYFVIDTLVYSYKTKQNHKHIDYFTDDIKANLELEDSDIEIREKYFNEDEICEYENKDAKANFKKEEEIAKIIGYIESLETILYGVNYNEDYNSYITDLKDLANINQYVKEFLSFFNELNLLITKKKSLFILKDIYNNKHRNKNNLFIAKYNSVVFALLEDKDVIKSYIIHNLKLNEFTDCKIINTVISKALSSDYVFKKNDKAYKFIEQISECRVKNKDKYNESISINNYNLCKLEETSKMTREEILKRNPSNSLFKGIGSSIANTRESLKQYTETP